MSGIKLNKYWFWAIVSIGIAIVLVIFLRKLTQVPETKTAGSGIPQEVLCYSAGEMIVSGNSMSGIVEGGATIKVLSGYYKCNEVQRNDLIIYNYGGGKSELLKIVKGISGDKFGFRETANGWNILINGEILNNAQNLPYVISEQGYRMLSLYEHDYKGVIPSNAYLILGNLTGGTLDSTVFGLVDKKDFLGKAEL